MFTVLAFAMSAMAIIVMTSVFVTVLVVMIMVMAIMINIARLVLFASYKIHRAVASVIFAAMFIPVFRVARRYV